MGSRVYTPLMLYYDRFLEQMMNNAIVSISKYKSSAQLEKISDVYRLASNRQCSPYG